MVYIANTMRFKRPYLTHEAALKLGVHKYTLWKMGESGVVRMYRDKITKIRIFDGDQIDALKIPTERKPGKGLFKYRKK